MWFRASRDMQWTDQQGHVLTIRKGELVDILQQDDVDDLMTRGIIQDTRHSAIRVVQSGEAASPFNKTLRASVWIATTGYYSGGRIHMYQYALALAMNGVETFIITNKEPAWRKDYPVHKNLKVIIEGKQAIPPDLDLVITDAKSDVGRKGLAWKRENPKIPLVVMSFETKNWVQEFVPDYAKALPDLTYAFKDADLLLANSAESMRWLERFAQEQGISEDKSYDYLYPAVNNMCEPASVGPHIRPYALISARSADYKGASTAVQAVWDTKVPLDLYMVGQSTAPIRITELHAAKNLQGCSDSEKYGYMRDAAVVLAPSLFEGCGMVPGEAISQRTPTIAYDLPVLREVYGDDGIILVEWQNSDAFKHVVASFIEKGFIKPSKTVHVPPWAQQGSPETLPRVPEDVRARTMEKMSLKTLPARIDKLLYHTFKRPSVSAYMICYWGFIPEAVTAIYDQVDEIIIAYGPVEHVAKRNIPPDGSLELIQALSDPDGKIKLHVRDVWKDKLQMRAFCADKARGNRLLLLDGDEIWVGLDEWIKAEQYYASPRWVNFWHSAKHWIYDEPSYGPGARWGRKVDPWGSVCPHYRWSWWRKSFMYKTHTLPADQKGRNLNSLHANASAAVVCPSTTIYHLGHMLSRETMDAKHQFYIDRDGDDALRQQRRRDWTEWDGTVGHFNDGIIEEVSWELPQIVWQACARLEVAHV